MTRNPFSKSAPPTSEDVKQYRRVRETSRRLNEDLANLIPTRLMRDVGEALGIVGEDGVFHLPSEDAMGVLTECCIHGWAVDGKTVLESFRERQAETGRPCLTDLEQRILEARSAAYHAVFRIEAVVRDVGVRAKDGSTGEAFFLIDKLLSQDPRAVGQWVSSRLVTYGDWKMTTGAPLVLGELSDTHVYDFLRNIENRHSKEGGSPEPLEQNRVTALAFTALGLRLLRTDIQHRPTPPKRRDLLGASPRRPARNRPCPCGSPSKYKNCCGK